MPSVLHTVATIVPLVLAAWALLAAALNRAPDRLQFLGTILTTLSVVALLVWAATDWHPRESATFIGYALTAVLLPYGAWALAKMEPTRYGSVIVGVAALIVPVLVLRMDQVWVAL